MKVGTVITALVLPRGSLRHPEGSILPQVTEASEWQSQNLNPGRLVTLTAKLCCLCKMRYNRAR